MLRYCYNWVMDAIALILFPSRRYLLLTLVTYFLLIALVLSMWSHNWLWVPATALCAVFAWMILEWFL